MYTIIWIRHAEKAYNNAKGPKDLPMHDPHILTSEHDRINVVSLDLVSKFGVPNYIFTSPFLRTRETAIKMYQSIASAGHKTPNNIIVDNTIEEYLGHQKPVGGKPSLDPDTSMFTNITLGESIDSLYKRTNEHISTLSIQDTLFKVYPNECINRENLVVWVITHGIIIKAIQEHLLSLIEKLPNGCKPIDNIGKVISSPETLTGLVLTGKFYCTSHTKIIGYNPFKLKLRHNKSTSSNYKILPMLDPIDV